MKLKTLNLRQGGYQERGDQDGEGDDARDMILGFYLLAPPVIAPLDPRELHFASASMEHNRVFSGSDECDSVEFPGMTTLSGRDSPHFGGAASSGSRPVAASKIDVPQPIPRTHNHRKSGACAAPRARPRLAFQTSAAENVRN